MNIRIREWKADDAESLAKMLNNRKIQNNLRDGISFPYTETDAEEFITNMLAADKSNVFAWAITADGKTIGSIGAFRKENIHRLTAETGYYVAEEFWGNGIATEAIKQACEYIFANSDIVRIFAEPFAHNTGSCRALEKAGFIYEGTLKKNAFKNGQIIDMKMYAIVKD